MHEMDEFIAQQRTIYPLSDEAVECLLEDMELLCFPKHTVISQEGKREPFVWFMKKGVARAYVEREGKDVTLWFASDGEMINFSYRGVAAYQIELVEDGELLRLPAGKWEELMEKSLELCNWGRKLLDYYVREYENYFINDSWSDARAQYEALMRSRPELFHKVPLKHIASYLQITPQSLSRIRSKLR